MPPDSRPETLFSFCEVTVSYGDHVVLNKVTAGISGDGITALLGASGSGKSTLLRLCNRLEVPDSGEIYFRGTAISSLDPLEVRKTIGMASQSPALFAGTVRSNLLVADKDADDATMVSALEDLDLPESMLDRNVDELSGGEAQRVSVARTLLASPQVLLADEATSAVDPETRELIEARVRSLADSGVPVLWVTHDLERVNDFADHQLRFPL